MSELKTASVLAFERNFDISDGIFSQGADDMSGMVNYKPVKIREKSVRGTISNRLKNKISNDPALLDAEIQKANLQKVDVAALDHDCNLLRADWQLKVLPFTGKPSVCNNQAYQEKLLEVVQGYIHDNGLHELSERYAYNMVNGRWLWRNRIGAKTIRLTVEIDCEGNKESMTFNDNVQHYPLNSFDISDNRIQTIAQFIEKGLLGEQLVMMKVTAVADIGHGQEVYPSEELILDKSNSNKSKVLYEVNGYAGLHSQKIGNAIRTIDNWYPDAQFPIAVEPYGAVTTLGTAFRQPKDKQDFYSLFDNWVLNDEKPDLNQQHYVIAVLLRGGVFGESGKE